MLMFVGFATGLFFLSWSDKSFVKWTDPKLKCRGELMSFGRIFSRIFQTD